MISEKNIKMANKLVSLVIVIYIYAMGIHPWFFGNWSYVSVVWYKWQSLNVGILAFTSSLIAFNISVYRNEMQRKRNFISERSLLPTAALEIKKYAYKQIKNINIIKNASFKPEQTPNINDYKKAILNRNEVVSVLKNCIRESSPEIGNYLSKLLEELQHIEARVDEVEVKFLSKHREYAYEKEYLSLIFELACINVKFASLLNSPDDDDTELYIEQMITPGKVFESLYDMNIPCEKISGLNKFVESLGNQ